MLIIFQTQIVSSFSFLYSTASLNNSDKMYKAIATPKNNKHRKSKTTIIITSKVLARIISNNKSRNQSTASTTAIIPADLSILTLLSQNGLFSLRLSNNFINLY